MECAAKEYGDCTYWGKKEVDVLFLYRDKYGGQKPDVIVKVCMCDAHRSVLEKYHEGRPLEMRGEEVDWALHDDLFTIFSDKTKTYTYVKMSRTRKEDSDETEYKYALVNGRNIEKFRQMMYASDPDIYYISEEAIFLTHYNVAKDEVEVIEMKSVTDEYDIHVLKNLPSYYSPVSDYITVAGQGWISCPPRVEENPTMETEYTIESALPCVQTYFAQKWEDHFRSGFEECLEFMANIDTNLVDITKLRETSPHTEAELLALVRKLTDVLCLDDRETLIAMKDSELTDEVLWVTYVMANHEHFWSHIPGRNLRKNINLIKLFRGAGLHGKLLLLAVSGERERCLDIHHRTHHDILHENVYVVRYLVPKYIQPRYMIALRKYNGSVTYNSAYNYYTEFSNAMYNCNPQRNEDPFEKNKYILLHLLKCILEEEEEGDLGKEHRLEYEALSEKIKEENKMWGNDKYLEKAELEWKNALENEGE